MGHTLGIIGYGGMGSWHAENITKRLDCVRVGGVYDIREEARRRAGKDGFRTYESAEDLLDSHVDIILVSTPNNFHKDYAVRALRKGKHVISEKPVCLNSAELEEIDRARLASGKLFTVHQNRRFDDDFNVVRKILRENIIGRPYFINSRLFGEKGLPGDWRSCKEAGGGMLYDWSVHLIDQILYLFDDTPHTVYAELKRVFFPEVDDCNRVNLIFDSGINVQIVVDTWCYQSEARWHIGGNDGTAAIYGWPEYTGEIVKANIKEIDWEEGVIFTSVGRTRTMAPRPKENLVRLPLPKLEKGERTDWEFFYRNVCAAIEGKEKLFVDMGQQKRLMKVIDACFLSDAEKRTVILK